MERSLKAASRPPYEKAVVSGNPSATPLQETQALNPAEGCGKGLIMADIICRAPHCFPLEEGFRAVSAAELESVPSNSPSPASAPSASSSSSGRSSVGRSNWRPRGTGCGSHPDGTTRAEALGVRRLDPRRRPTGLDLWLPMFAATWVAGSREGFGQPQAQGDGGPALKVASSLPGIWWRLTRPPSEP